MYGQFFLTDRDWAKAMRTQFWSERTLRQGFMLGDAVIAFLLISDGIDGVSEIAEAGALAVSCEAGRAILVPVKHRGGPLRVFDVMDPEPWLEVCRPAGDYGLLFESWVIGGERVGCRLTFIPGHVDVPRLLRADAALSPVRPLQVDGTPFGARDA